MSFEEELNNIRPYRALCCLPADVTINGKFLDYTDFGKKEDIDRENAPDYCCGNMQFIPFEDVKKATLKKYKINETQYRQIQKKLDCLSFGSCGWCS